MQTIDAHGDPMQPGGLGPFQSLILGHPTFVAEYDLIMCRLLADPLQAAEVSDEWESGRAYLVMESE